VTDDEREPVPIESRPSGMQVISARLPTGLAERTLAVATAEGVRPSEVVRRALAAFLGPSQAHVSVTASSRIRFLTPLGSVLTENPNLIAQARITSCSPGCFSLSVRD
jgi:hypothetical protein